MVDIGVHAADLMLTSRSTNLLNEKFSFNKFVERELLYFGQWRATVRNLLNKVDAKVSAENSALARKICSSVDSVLSASR